MTARDQLQSWVEASGESLVLAVLGGMGFSGADARDLAQTVWLRALRYAAARGGFGAVRSPEDWLARLARNAGSDFYRELARERRRLGGRAADPDDLPLTDRGEDVFERIDREELLDVFARTAPGRVVAAFFLVCRQGWGESAIARHLGVSVRTVRRDLREARGRLCELMGLPVPTGSASRAAGGGASVRARRGHRPGSLGGRSPSAAGPGR